MKVYLILCLIGVIIGFAIAFAWVYRKTKTLKDLEDKQEKTKQLNNIDKVLDERRAELFDIGKVLDDRRAELFDIEAKIQNELIRSNHLEQHYNNLSKNAQELQSQLQDLKQFGTNQINEQLEEYKRKEEANIQNELSQYVYTCEKKKDQVAVEINDIEENLKDLKKKQEVINQAILRKREIEEQVDYYKVAIPDADQKDIQALLEIENRIRNKEAIRKLIWDLYIKRPVAEMEKRVLQNKDVCGIYKITNIKTQEAYIGKSTNIKTRWINHLKTVIGLSGAARSTLHNRMEKDGLWNYTFEVLEEVNKDNLSAREAYWINFYDTKNYGLNMKEGSYGT